MHTLPKSLSRNAAEDEYMTRFYGLVLFVPPPRASSTQEGTSRFLSVDADDEATTSSPVVEDTMHRTEHASLFAALHRKGAPVLLYNVWDAGSAKAIVDAGAPAVATSSWAVAEAHGYRDGETIPRAFVESIVERIVATTAAPVTVDFESGYSDDDEQLAANVSRLIDLGVAGINFEDQVVKGSGLYPIERQARRIEVIRETANQKSAGLFINARTDLFLGQGNEPRDVVDEALLRARAYANAGASGFFIPGLDDVTLIARICDETELPVNVMTFEGMPSNDRLREAGVARISYGPIPYRTAMATLRKAAAPIYATG